MFFIQKIGPTPYQEKHPQTITLPPPFLTVFSVYCGEYSLPFGLLAYVWNKLILDSSDHKIFRHFSFGQLRCSWAIFFLLCALRLVNNGHFRGLLEDNLFSINLLLVVEVLTSKPRSFLISVEVANGRVFTILTIWRSVCGVVFRGLPLVSLVWRLRHLLSCSQNSQ